MHPQFLEQYQEDAIGPVQRQEALFLYALTAVVRPQLVLEIGSAHGHSSRCFLEAGAEHVIAVDIMITRTLKRLACQFPALKIVKGSQESFPLRCLMRRKIDILFIDASHNFDLDCQAFARLRPYLSASSLVIVHDTCAWQKKYMRKEHFEHVNRFGKDLGSTCVHQPDVLRFVGWLRQQGLVGINLWSTQCIRHGLTILQSPV